MRMFRASPAAAGQQGCPSRRGKPGREQGLSLLRRPDRIRCGIQVFHRLRPQAVVGGEQNDLPGI